MRLGNLSLSGTTSGDKPVMLVSWCSSGAYHALANLTHCTGSRPNTPAVSWLQLSGTAPSRLIRPWLGLLPYVPDTAAGLRIDDPVSLPMALSSHSYAATEHPPPDEDAEHVK